MSTGLLDNLYILPKKIQPKHAPELVFVMVESYADVGFWADIFYLYQNKKVKFEVKPCIQESGNHGKLQALKLVEQATKNFIIAIDSDYDYLLQSSTAISKKINEHEFIFQTYAYAIENLRCYAPYLNVLCAKATNNNSEILDLDELMQTYSETIAPLFLWSVWLTKQGKASQHFSIKSFCKIIVIEPKKDNEAFDDFYKNRLEDLQNKVNAKCSELAIKFPKDAEKLPAFAENLQLLGWNANETYLFAKGHTILPEVVRHFINPTAERLKTEKITEIASKKISDTEADKRHYEKSLSDVTTLLNANTEFKNCHLYGKLKTDLDIYTKTYFN
jgi:hypothetical protein